jgi:serine/threonine protein kinase
MRRFLHPILWVKEDACFNSLCRYLHEVCLPAMVHRNFKSANILLDDEMNPHLSDCGIAAFTPLGVERQVKNTFINLFSFQTSKIT